MFDTVTRNKIRFNTNKGMVSVEDLWDMPLQAKNNFDLDTVAKAIAADIRKNDEDSFIATATKTKRVGDAARRAQLQTAIADKSEDALKNMSVAELEAEMALLK